MFDDLQDRHAFCSSFGQYVYNSFINTYLKNETYYNLYNCISCGKYDSTCYDCNLELKRAYIQYMNGKLSMLDCTLLNDINTRTKIQFEAYEPFLHNHFLHSVLCTELRNPFVCFDTVFKYKTNEDHTTHLYLMHTK